MKSERRTSFTPICEIWPCTGADCHGTLTRLINFCTELIDQISRKSENMKSEMRTSFTPIFEIWPCTGADCHGTLTRLINFCTEFIDQISRKSENKCEK